MSADKAGYGKTCNARFWPEPHELSCERPPGHDGDHLPFNPEKAPANAVMELVVNSLGDPGRKVETSAMAERFEILRWAGTRPGVLSLLAALRENNYDETGTEHLRRIVSRGALRVDASALRYADSRGIPSYNHTREDSRETPCPECAQHPHHIPIASVYKTSDWHWVCADCGEGREQKSIGGLDKMRTCAECGATTVSPHPACLVSSLSKFPPRDKCANCGLDIAVGKHVGRGEEGMCEIPVQGSEPRRATTIVR